MTPTFSKQRIDFTDADSGITVSYTKCRRELYVSGWYDNCVGIEGGAIGLGDFLRGLGVTLKDCQKALEGGESL